MPAADFYNSIKPAFLFPILLLTSSFAMAHPGGHERIMTLNEQIEHDPQNAYLLIKRAHEHIEEERKFEVAIKDLDKAHQLGATEDSSAEYNFVMGLYHQYQHQYPQSIAFFRNCIQLDPNHLQCHRGWADSALGQNDDQTAIEVLTSFIKNSSTAQPDDYFHLAQLHEKGGHTPKALMYLDQGQAKFGSLPHFEKYAIKLEIAYGNFPKALDRHLKLKEFFGKTPQWSYELGVLYQNMGKVGQAKAAFNDALATLQNQKKKKNKASKSLQQDIENRIAKLEQ